jgi:branched-chain amino acid transport system substrate-binding protein
VSRLPRNVDGVLLLTGGTDTVSAEKGYVALGGNLAKKMLGGSSVMDPTSFTVGDALNGMAGGSPVPLGGASGAWKSYIAGFSKVYPKAPADSLFTVLYADGMQAIIQGLQKTNGDVATLGARLAKLTPSFPNGTVRPPTAWR